MTKSELIKELIDIYKRIGNLNHSSLYNASKDIIDINDDLEAIIDSIENEGVE